MRMRARTASTLCLLTWSAAALAQAPPPPQPAPATSQPPRDQPRAVTGTGILRGRVTRLDNGQPLRRVLIIVSATGLSLDLPPTLTDGNGRFELTGLPAASYTLTASKDGFVTLQYGQRRPNQPGQPIELPTAATLEGVDLALPRGGVVTGRVLNAEGVPVRNAIVQVLRRRFVYGQRQLAPNVVMPDITDDRGEFRIYGIPPGTYYISTTTADPIRSPRPSGGEDGTIRLGSTTTFYPGTPSLEAAQQVTVGLAQEVAGISFTLAPSSPASIAVTVQTSEGQPAPQTTRIWLNRPMLVGPSPLPGEALGGSRTWTNLPPGEYLVTALVMPSGESASARVALDGVDATVALTLQKPDTARGRVTFDEGVAPASLRPADIRLLALPPDPARTAGCCLMASPPVLRTDWTFEMTMAQGAWLIHPNLPSGWAVTSVRLGDADITNTPLVFTGRDIEGIEIRVTNRVADVSGVIRDARGELVTDATVVLFADDSARWGFDTRYVAVARPNQNGIFTHRGLPPARYVAVALDYLEPGEETNPETLRRLLNAGTTFTLSGESKTLDLTLSSLP